jgi:hypothetical protein
VNVEAWQGKSVWIWELAQSSGGDVGAIIARAKSAKLRSLIIKVHDGREAWSQLSESLVKKLHDAELLVGAWGYCYGRHVQAEADNAGYALAAGADFYVADVESEFERAGMANVASDLMGEIRKRAQGKPVGYSSFGLPKYHPQFPFEAFSSYADFAMPQVYWNDFGMPPKTATQESIAHYRRYQVPLVPIGQAYGNVTVDQIRQFLAACRDLPGYSFWDYQSMTAETWSAISDEAAASKGVNKMLTRGSQDPSVKLLQQELNLVLDTNLKIDGIYERRTEAAVKTFQQRHHLKVDGIAGPMTLTTLGQALYRLPDPEIARKLNGVSDLLKKAENTLRGVT